MLGATVGTLALACLVGLALVPIGGLWLLPLGIVIAAAAIAYNAVPWPLSRHGLGEVAVIIFFGIIPVWLTSWLQTRQCSAEVILGGIAVGLLAANVLIVNNYRDASDDRAVGKHTLAVILRANHNALALPPERSAGHGAGISAVVGRKPAARPACHRGGRGGDSMAHDPP